MNGKSYERTESRKDEQVMNGKRIIRRLLPLCLILGVGVSGLTGCHGRKNGSGDPKVQKAHAVDRGKLKDKSVVISVGDTTVTYAEYLTYQWLLQTPLKTAYPDALWNYEFQGKSMDQESLEELLKTIIQIKILVKESDGNNVSLGVDEIKDMDHKADELYASIPEDEVKNYKISKELLHRIYEENNLAVKMYEVWGKDVGGEGTEAEKIQKVTWEFTPEDKEEKYNEAKAWADGRASYAGNFMSYAAQTGKLAKEEYVGDLDKDETLHKEALLLEKGGMAGPVETEDAYVVLSLVDKNSKAVLETYQSQILSIRQRENFVTVYEIRAQKYEVKVSHSLVQK